MADFTFTSPTGQSYTVSGPEGSTAAQAFQMLQQHLGSGNNPAQTKVPGYTASDTGQFTPIQNAGKPANQGSATLGALQGASNVAGNAAASIPSGVAGAAGFIKGLLTPGQDAGNTAQDWMQGTQQTIAPAISSYIMNGGGMMPSILRNPLAKQALQGPETQAANQAVQTGAASVGDLLQNIYDPSNKVNPALLTPTPGMRNAANMSPAWIKTQAAISGLHNVASQVAPIAAGAFAGAVSAPKPTPATDLSNMSPQDISDALENGDITPLQAARQLNLKVKPSSVGLTGGSAPVGKVLEGIGGSAKVGVESAVDNQPMITRLAADDIPSIQKGVAITDTVLDNARKPYIVPYNKIETLSDTYGKIPMDDGLLQDIRNVTPENAGDFGENPDIVKLQQKYSAPDEFSSASLLREVKTLRKNASANYTVARNFTSPNAPEAANLADAQQGIANALEDRLDRFASKIPGQEDLVSQWKDARVNLAKINTLDNAIPAGTNDVSAPFLAKQLDKGVPLSGNMRTIAQLAHNYTDEMRFALPIKNKVPMNVLDSAIGLGGGVASAATGRFGPLAASLDWMVGRPLLRMGLLSGPFQNTMLPSAPLSPMMAGMRMPLALQAGFTGNQNPLLGNQK